VDSVTFTSVNVRGSGVTEMTTKSGIHGAGSELLETLMKRGWLGIVTRSVSVVVMDGSCLVGATGSLIRAGSLVGLTLGLVRLTLGLVRLTSGLVRALGSLVGVTLGIGMSGLTKRVTTATVAVTGESSRLLVVFSCNSLEVFSSEGLRVGAVLRGESTLDS